MKYLLFSFCAFFLLNSNSCNTASQTKTIWVNSYKADCVGVGPMSCLLISEANELESAEWQFFYDTIKWFDYEPGYIYQLEIREKEIENPPADASSIKTTLVKVISKERESRNSIVNIWKLIYLEGDDFNYRTSDFKNARLEINSNMSQYFGYSGCNNFGGELQIKPASNDIAFKLGQITEKACFDMNAERDYMKHLRNVKTYEIVDGQLHLKDEYGVARLKFKNVD